MPLDYVERRGQAYGKNGGRRLYGVRGTLNAAEAAARIFVGTGPGVAPVAPTVWGDLYLLDYEAREMGFKVWEVEAIYGIQAIEIFQGLVQVSVDTTGGSFNQVQALPGGVQFPATPAVGFGGVIGVGNDGSIAGVDRPIPRMAIEMRTRFNTSQVTDAYLAQLFQATGRINLSAWRSFKAQELLFLGASLQQMNALQWDASFRFLAEYEGTVDPIGAITGITKKGWQYLWTYYKPISTTMVDGITRATPQPSLVRVENVFKTLDFNLLAIPGATGGTSGFFGVPTLAP